MPKAVRYKCGKVWYGWALKYKSSTCSCGEPLNQRALGLNGTYIIRHVDAVWGIDKLISEGGVMIL